ncbi:MAG: transcriptional repressor, partial [Trueperella pyogenes]|nr:transcriptional repressor [Trueperella pyogenes]
HHHHLVCRNCGRAEDLGAGELEKWISAVASSHGYTQIEHSIELFGLCSDCTRKADS